MARTSNPLFQNKHVRQVDRHVDPLYSQDKVPFWSIYAAFNMENMSFLLSRVCE